MEHKNSRKTSKFLSLVLRHKPETIDLTLDEKGWADVQSLLTQLKKHGRPCSWEELKYIVESNDKKRFAFDENFTKIRANQGHSIQVNLGYTPQKPPPILYHGTARKYIGSIFKSGLEKRDRHHVHLSTILETASKVGSRHGKPVIIEVLALDMYHAGFEFFLSENGVWLVDNVPVPYLRTKE